MVELEKNSHALAWPGQSLPRIAGEGPGGPRCDAWFEALTATECPAITFRRQRRAAATPAAVPPIVLTAASGSNLADADGNIYSDWVSGFGACLIGHGHPAVLAAIAAQAHRLLHGLGDALPNDRKIALCQRLAQLTPRGAAQTILAQSGSEAVIAAYKTAVLKTGKTGVIAFEGGYHGLLTGALPLSHYRPAFREPFAALHGAHVEFLPFPTGTSALVYELAGAISRSGHAIGAVIAEPLQGRGGNRVFGPENLRVVRDFCSAHGLVFIADEIFCGCGRIGPLSMCFAAGVEPDILCLGKALGGGMPISAAVGTPEVMAAWGPSAGEAIHTSTFLGHPVGCAAALAALEILTAPGFAAQVAQLSGAIRDALTAAVRAPLAWSGEGLALGLHCPAWGGAEGVWNVCQRLLLAGHLALPCGLDGQTLALNPAVTLAPAQIDHFAATLAAITAEAPEHRAP